ncbi:MAG: ABC transporter ATP-binding protein [Leptolyngbya sp. RL_3_1]|nr:ABC transporter ATP-binding protein [Leptolyngbya sp. RL_3_1]
MAQTVSSTSVSTVSTQTFDVELRQVSKVFEGEPAVDTIDLQVKQGEFFSILGPSGCGKTTTLRLIAGFEQPTQGAVLIQGRRMEWVPPYQRPVNTVFQSYALFSHLTVWDNIAFGLRIKGLAKTQMKQRVNEALKLVKMEDFARRHPKQLSGGQRQRIALARALVNRPAVMLLDEPLGALDLKLRKEMQVELSNLHQQLGITFVMVTHDQEEALSLSDRIAVMQNGKIAQVGSPSDIYEFPRTPFVADFIGDTNLLQGQVDDLDGQVMRVQTTTGLAVLVQRSPDPEPLKQVVVSIRPEKIHLSTTATTDSGNCYSGFVKHKMYLGTHLHCMVQLDNGDCLTVLQPNRTGNQLAVETRVYVHWLPTDCLALAA